ncbi:MAG: serine hydrolase, partial [Anaerolineaceae bacterium]
QNILLPLGMNRSTYLKADIEKDIDVAVPYINAADGKRIPSTYAYGSINAAGGLISSVHEMAKVVSMYLNHGAYPGGQLLSKASLETMQTPRVDTAQKEGPFGQYAYALGLGVLPNFLGRRLVGHSGSVGTSTAYMGFLPEEKLGVVALVNGSGYSPSAMGQYALASELGEDPDKLPFVKTDRLLKELTGNYETYMGTTKITVRKAGDFLMMVNPGKFGTATTPLIPVNLEGNHRTFYTLSANHKIYGEFDIEPGRTTFVFERYAYRKTGDIA